MNSEFKMVLVEVNKGRGLTLPASVRKKYSLWPGARLELKDRNGEIVLTPLGAKDGNIFELIDKNTRAVSDKELAEIKKRIRTHAFLH